MKLYKLILAYIIMGIVSIVVTIGAYIVLAYIIVKIVKAVW